MVEKEEFLAMLEGVVSRIDSGEELLVCRDLTGMWCLKLMALRVCMEAIVHAVGGHLRRDEHKGQVPRQVWLHGMYKGHNGPIPALIPEDFPMFHIKRYRSSQARVYHVCPTSSGILYATVVPSPDKRHHKNRERSAIFYTETPPEE